MLKRIVVVAALTPLLMQCEKPTSHTEKGTASPTNTADDIASIEDQIREHRQNNNYVDEARLSLERNYRKERASVQGQGAEQEAAVERKYSILNSVLDDQVNKYQQSVVTAPNRNVNDPNYPKPHFPVVYHDRELEVERDVKKTYGDFYLGITTDCSGEPIADVYQAKNIPWSGFWYPLADRSLYEVDPAKLLPHLEQAGLIMNGKIIGTTEQVDKIALQVSDDEAPPLMLFDRVMTKLGRVSTAAAAERDRRLASRASWEGLCDALSIAAITTKEPKEEKVIKGVKFSVSKQKALLILSHLQYPVKTFGIPYQGTMDTDGTYQDIRPDLFHSILATVLGQQKRAVIIDDTAGVPVWNKPLYRYWFKVSQDPEYDAALRVKASTPLRKEKSSATDALTSKYDQITIEYEYRVYVDKALQKDGRYKVIASEWLGKSRRDHPDTVMVPELKSDVLGSYNEQFDKNIDAFKEAFKTILTVD